MLDLTLLLAAKHLVRIHGDESFNFETVFHEYHKFVSRKCSAMLSFSRAVMMKSWELLISLELIRPLDKGSRIQNEYKQYALDVMPEEIECVAANAHCLPLDVKEWADSGISGV